jgi:ATP-dependent RNA helicase RhlE
MDFRTLGLSEELLDGLDAMNIKAPTPIQQQAIPAALDQRDLIACAQTGTGKTAAFLLPLIDTIISYRPKVDGSIRGLIVVPTRELALQIDQQIQAIAYFTPITSIPLYGGSDGANFDQQKQRTCGWSGDRGGHPWEVAQSPQPGLCTGPRARVPHPRRG